MKYGTELSKRSIPEWKAYNLDYNEMKKLIRAATTPSHSHELRVDMFFNSLASQLDNIELFIKSKSGETNLRLGQCEKIVHSINKTTTCTNDNTIPLIPKHLKRKLKLELFQLSNDLQNLTRFIGVQRNGFRKLLKKYRKWLPNAHVSPEQEQREKTMIDNFNLDLYNPDIYLNRDFSEIFQKLSDLYIFLRDGHNSIAVNANAKFDCDMVVQRAFNSLTFWIHPDNVMETKISLLKNLSIVQSSAQEQLMPEQEPSTQRLSDSYVSSAMHSTYLDDSAYSAYSHRTEPGQLRFVASDTTYLCAPVGGLRHFCIAPVTSDQVNSILTTDYPALQKLVADSASDGTLKRAVGWVATKKARPVCKTYFNRTRFKYVDNDVESTSPSSISGTEIWVTMDCGIKYSTSSLESISAMDDDARDFPYSVLQVKWRNLDGGVKPKWLTELETSHLVYEVPGFSMFAHALGSASEVTGARPNWMPLIETNTDIRKTPQRPKVRREKTPPSQTSILLNQSTLSNGGGSYGAVPSATGYWNEFDHPEDPDEGFYITIPDSESGSDDETAGGLLSEANVDYLLSLTDKAYTKVTETLENWFRYKPEDKHKKQRSLSIIYEEPEDDENEFHDYHYKRPLSNHSSNSSTSSSWSGNSGGKFSSGFYNYPEYYGPSKRRRQRDSILTVLYTTCFIIAALTVTALLAALVCMRRSMETLSLPTVMVIAAGTVVAVAVDLLAMMLYLWRTDVPDSVLHQLLVYAVFFGVVCVGIGEVCWLIA